MIFPVLQTSESDSKYLEFGAFTSTGPFTRPLAHSPTPHTPSLAAVLARSAALTHSPPNSWDSGIFLSDFQIVLTDCDD